MPPIERGRPIEILLVEDSAPDAELTAELMADARVANRLTVVSDGEQAMAYLRREECYGTATRPDLILLDLNLPKRDGREVLAEIKRNPELCRIPVVVLTTSSAEQDILRVYNLQANAYVTKPIDLNQFIAVIRSIEQFWLTVVTLPPQD